MGVAASLLAPLLPDDVKEEEERWRKKVICKEEVAAASEDEEDMAAVCTDGEPAVDDQAQDDLCSTVQSGESEEEMEEQDTLELERVLERKRVWDPSSSLLCARCLILINVSCGIILNNTSSPVQS